MKTITIKQPFASLIVEGIKDIENRTRKCPSQYIGHRVLIHAQTGTQLSSQSFLSAERLIKAKKDLDKNAKFDNLFLKGAIIGSVEILGCVINHESIWAEKTPYLHLGKLTIECQEPIYNWTLANPIKFTKPIFVMGRLGFWESECEILICPKCNSYCLHDNHDLEVNNWGNPIHECEHCGYIILESEFEYLK